MAVPKTFKEIAIKVIDDEAKEKKNGVSKMSFKSTVTPIGKRGILAQTEKKAKSLPIPRPTFSSPEAEKQYDAKIAVKRARRAAHRIAARRGVAQATA